jgi:hypothetical protein
VWYGCSANCGVETMEVRIFEPSDVQKNDIEKRIMKMIACLDGLTIEEKALALKVLMDS